MGISGFSVESVSVSSLEPTGAAAATAKIAAIKNYFFLNELKFFIANSFDSNDI